MKTSTGFKTRLALLVILVMLVPTISSRAQAEPGLPALEREFLETLSDYAQQFEGIGFAISSVRADGPYAYAIAESVADPSQAGMERTAVMLLARQQEDLQWEVLAPTLVAADHYNWLLDAFPGTLIDDATKAFFHDYSGARPAGPPLAPAHFTGHKLPWPAVQTAVLTQKGNCWSGGCSGGGHDNQLDFDILGYATDGEVFASRPGTVVFVKDSSYYGDCAFNAWRYANMVVIQHGPAEYSWYVHLAPNSVPVEVYDQVNFGTRIGQEGETGYACGVHLHYMASTGHTTFTDPYQADEAPWATGITRVDFEETTWDDLFAGSSYFSHNSSDGTVPPLDLVSNLADQSEHSYQMGACADGDRYYTDGGQTIAGFSDSDLSGLLCIKTPLSDYTNGDEQLVAFDLNRPARIYVYLDRRTATRPGWLERFSPTGDWVDVSDGAMGYFDVYACDSAAGHIVLGGPRQGGGAGNGAMYVVAFRPIERAPGAAPLSAPGCNDRPFAPVAPAPGDEATGVPITTTLRWIGGGPEGAAIIYDVTLDAGDSSPQTVVCDDITDAFCALPTTLAPNITYFWQVVATDGDGLSTSGKVWSFRVEATDIVHLPLARKR